MQLADMVFKSNYDRIERLEYPARTRSPNQFKSNYDRIESGQLLAGRKATTLFKSNYDRIERQTPSIRRRLYLPCLNRTIIGLKIWQTGRPHGRVLCLNRTMIGLKGVCNLSECSLQLQYTYIKNTSL